MQNVVRETVVQSSPERVASVATVNATDTPTQTTANIIYFVAGLVEMILLARLLLKMTGANPSSGFVSGIYGLTQILILPFRGIFSSAVTNGVEVRAIFEPATLIAMLVYAAIAWGIVRLVAILAGHSSEQL